MRREQEAVPRGHGEADTEPGLSHVALRNTVTPSQCDACPYKRLLRWTTVPEISNSATLEQDEAPCCKFFTHHTREVLSQQLTVEVG